LGRPWGSIVATDDDAPAALENAQKLPVKASDIRWIFPVQTEHAKGQFDRIALQGLFTATSTQISEVIPGGSERVDTEMIPVKTNLVEIAETKKFGIEERVRIIEPFHFSWRSGNKPAGILIRHQLTWPSEGSYVCEMIASGKGAVTAALSNQDQLDREAPKTLHSIQLSELPKTYVLDGAKASHREWQGLTLVAPNDAGWINIESITIRPKLQTAAPPKTGAWAWDPKHWMTNPELIWKLQKDFLLQQVFITVPVENQSVKDPDLLAKFIGEASERGLEVRAVIGDPHLVLASTRPFLIKQLKALMVYNRQNPKAKQLSAVQLDIEPHLLPGFHLNPALWRDRFFETTMAAYNTLEQSIPLDMVVPVWWGNHPQFGESLLSKLNQDGLSITVMNYRTDINRLLTAGAPFMRWSSTSGNDVYMALETGPLLDEQRRTYAVNPDRGELWLTHINKKPFWILFKHPVSGLDGKAFALTEETKAEASHLTFGGNLKELREAMEQLNIVWSQWPNFRGIAIHGLDHNWNRETQGP
jgi:hypothetical protein